MKILKQIISTFLLLALLVGMVPTNVLATDATATAQTGQTTIAGTNSFGDLLSEEINEQQETEEENYSGGYTVTGLTISDSVATVTYSSLEEATLVVALYTEDGLQLLVSGSTTVQPEETEVVVELQGEIPEYFTASAYLLDNYDHSPLCSAYDTPMYTREMQDLLASSTDDYEEDRVLNLDDDKSTNFAVYTDSTIVIKEQEGVNTVVSANDETATYVFENADHNITDLQAGQVFAYSYGENEILIVKVASVSINGTTATILGDDLELEEAFSHIKIESTGATKDFTVDDSTISEGISYNGIVKEDVIQPYGLRIDGEVETEHNFFEFHLDKKVGDNVKLKGTISLNIQSSLSYYVSSSRQFIEFKTDGGIKASLSVSGKATVAVSLGHFYIVPIFGVYVGFEPEVQAQFSTSATFTLRYGTELGFSFESGKGSNTWCTTKEPETDLSIKGTVFVGIDLKPVINVVSKKVLNTELSCPIGIELVFVPTGKSVTGEDTVSDSIHTCYDCLDITFKFKAKLSVEIEFFKVLKYESDPLKIEFTICKMYRSFDYDEWLLGECPHKEYRVTYKVLDDKGIGISDVLIDSEGSNVGGITNAHGVVINYLPSGTYTVIATIDENTVETTFEVNEARIVTLTENTKGIFDSVNKGSVTDHGTVLDSGTCAENITWVMYSDGFLDISGSGAMLEINWLWSDAFSIQAVRSVRIGPGITNIAGYAFQDFSGLTNVEIPATITEIGERAFQRCNSLTNVILPYGVTSIDWSAFSDCTNLERITLPETLTSISMGAFSGCSKLNEILLPSHVNYIGNGAFSDCSSLTSINIPDEVVFIGQDTFENCSSLTSVSIHDKITSISSSAFVGCTNLTGIWVDNENEYYCNDAYGVLYNKNSTTLVAAPGALEGAYVVPSSVTSIDDFAFAYCRKLTDVTLPQGVTAINQWLFAGCTNLERVALPDNIAVIEGYAFYECKNLVDITLPDTITSLGDSAFEECNSLPRVSIKNVSSIGEETFYRCYNLTSAILSDNLTSVGVRAFSGCRSLADFELPQSVTSIGDEAFYDCSSLESIIIPPQITSIGNVVFYNCSKLTDIVIPSGVTSIGYGAFSGCSGLTSIEIPSGVTDIGNGAFSGCSGLTYIEIPASATNIGEGVFSGCSNLVDVMLPEDILRINDSTFRNCESLVSFNIPEGVTSIGYGAFEGCSGLTSFIIPASVTSIEREAFRDCSSLTEIRFCGNAPTLDYIFHGVRATIYYPANDATWQADILQAYYGGRITWVAYSVSANNEMLSDMSSAVYSLVTEETSVDVVAPEHSDHNSNISTFAIWGGEYESEEMDEYTLKTASFSGLVPEKEYLLLAMVDISADDPVNAENLLFIKQKASASDGTLVFQYVQRISTDTSYVVACGASNKNLNEATITFPVMIADDIPQAVNPTVIFGENTLIEGKDYIIVGTVDYTTPGEYTCFVRGVHNYTGLVQCQYVVEAVKEIVVNEQKTGEADLESSPDTFKFEPTETGVYRVNIVSPNNSLFNLRDSAGNTLVSKSGSQIVVDQSMTAGAFYLLETLFTDLSISGEFTISVEKLVPATAVEIIGDNTIIGYVGDSCNLATSFSPDNAIVETVNWTSSNTDIAEVDQSGCVKLLAPGTTIITATSENGLTDSISITIKRYRELAVNVQADATINNAGTSCYFAFTPNESGYYAFYSISDADTYGYIMDENANTLASDDDDGDGSNFKIKYLMEAGKTYILQARYYSSKKTGNFGVCIEEIKCITDLEIIDMPVRSEYIKEFVLDALDFTGLKLKVTWSDGSTTNWTYNGSWYIEDEYISWDTSSTEESGNVVISCGDASVTLCLTLIDNPVDYIEIVTAPTREYIYGDREWGWLYSDGSYEFYPSDLTGLKFTVHNIDGTTNTFTSADIDNHSLIDGYYYSISFDGDNPDLGDFPVTFSYLGKSADYTVKLKESPVASISVTRMPATTTYDSNYSPDFVGTEFTIVFANGTTKKVVLSEDNLVYEYNWNLGLIHSVIVDGYKLTIEPYYSDDGESYMAYYLDQCTEINGFTFAENQEITAISLENVHSTGDNMNVTITYQDGSVEKLKLDVLVYGDYYGVIEGYAKTNKGLLYYSIEPKEDVQGNTIGYEVYILGHNIEVEATAVIYGDVNGDGVVDTLDRMVLSRYLANWDEYDTNSINMDAADVNGDGVVDTLDRMVLNRYLANWDGYEDLPYVG